MFSDISPLSELNARRIKYYSSNAENNTIRNHVGVNFQINRFSIMNISPTAKQIVIHKF